MRNAMLGLLSLLLLGLTLAGSPHSNAALAAPSQDAGPEESGETPDVTPQRVIIEVGRFETSMGVVELENDEVIVIRSRKGEVESFPKARILRIVRLVDPEPGQSGVVIMRNGQAREGVIIEDTFEHVLIEIEGIRARLLRESVDHVVLQPTFEQTYRRFKAAIVPGNLRQHMELCRWLFQERKYVLCKSELDELLEQGELADARRLMRLVDAQLTLLNPAGENNRPKPEDVDDSNTGEDPVVIGSLAERPDILTHDDVNLIRVYEIDFDQPPRVMLEPATIQKLIETYSNDKLIPASRAERNALFHAEPINIVEHLIFELRARELYPEIKVLTEPPALNTFRLHVHNTWLMNNCASTDCHGGKFGGRLFLHRTGYRDARVRYTNFLILDRLTLDPELPPLIDYDHPENSLLLQYGMPRDEARYAHPNVPNWQPAFAPGNRKATEKTIEWIKGMMYPRPVYPIDFEPPTPPLDVEIGNPDAPDQTPGIPMHDTERPMRKPR